MIVQMIRFRLRPETDDEDFLAITAEAGQVFLQTQPGFLGREVCKAEDGSWVGLIRWQDKESCEAAGAAWQDHPLAVELDGVVVKGEDELHGSARPVIFSTCRRPAPSSRRVALAWPSGAAFVTRPLPSAGGRGGLPARWNSGSP